MSMSTLVRDFLDLDDIEEVWAREYLRVSKDESGRARSNTEQHDDHVAWAERKRWHLGEPYEDVGSASNRKKKRRLDFDQLMADLRAGTFGAHVLMIWEPSRGSREVPEWYALLGLCQQQRVFVFVLNVRRVFNPRVARDWKDLMTMAVDAEHEVMQLVERQERANDADAAAGRFTGGRRPFGYEADGMTVDPVEKAHIVEAVGRVLGGETVRSIAAEWNARGIKTSAGNAWHPGPLAKMLASSRIAGKRIHKGVVVGDAAWPQIIDEVTHKRIVATLRSRSPVGRRGRTPWLMTGLLTCGRILDNGKPCGAALVGNTDIGGTRRYICRKAPGYHGCGGLTIKAADLESTLGLLATERLADVDARRQADTGPDDSDELAELDRIAVMRVEIADDKAAGKLSRDQALEDAAALDRRQHDIERSLASKVRDASPLDFVVGEGYVGRNWDDLDVSEQRILLDALIERIKVTPATTRGSTRFEISRVTAPGNIAWRPL